MATYLILNLIFLIVICLILGIGFRKKPSKASLVTCAVLLLLTLVFDNLIIGLSIVDYDPAKILGIKLGLAPIEDFMYAILAVLIVPTLWTKFGDKND